jgi:hypothetical protein
MTPTLDPEGRLAFDPAALESSAVSYRHLGLSAAKVTRIARRHRAEQLSDTAEWLGQAA